MPTCNGAVGAYYLYDADSSGAPAPGYLGSLENALKQNGCVGTQTEPWPGRPDVCVEYSACPKQHSVVLCKTQGQGQSDMAGYAIPGFTKFFDMMAPR
jgi:hypothetical protein